MKYSYLCKFIMSLINREFENYYSEFLRNGVSRVITPNVFSGIVCFVLRNEKNHSGTIEQRNNQMLNALDRNNSSLFIPREVLAYLEYTCKRDFAL